MSSNKLFEAAAEILAGSKKSASAMPPEKLPGQVVDTGGPTPQNYKNDDNSAKITPSSKSATAPTTKPSDASAKMEEEQVEGEVIAEDEVQAPAAIDLSPIFGDDLSEDFKAKATSIFEAAVIARVNSEMETVVEKLEEQNAEQLFEYNRVHEMISAIRMHADSIPRRHRQ
jgi:hypothetical protein